jgi:hypothetical protein
MPLDSGKYDKYPAYRYLCGTTAELSGGADWWLM